MQIGSNQRVGRVRSPALSNQVWRITRPLTDDSPFGDPLVLPAWDRQDCPVCDRSIAATRAAGQRMVWQAGEPMNLGDFVWNDEREDSDAFVSSDLAAKLGHLAGVEFTTVPVEPTARNQNTGRPSRRLRAAFVQQLESYRRLTVTQSVPMDIGASTVRISPQRGACATCGMLMLDWRDPNPDRPAGASPESDLVIGVEWVEKRLFKKFGEPNEFIHHRRKPGYGAVFRRSAVGDLSLWTVEQDGRPSIFCDERFRQIALESQPTNVEFSEVGTIVDP